MLPSSTMLHFIAPVCLNLYVGRTTHFQQGKAMFSLSYKKMMNCGLQNTDYSLRFDSHGSHALQNILP